MIRAVNELTIHSIDWAIKVRLTKKCDIKTFGQGFMAGSLVPLELIDEEGTQITASLFCDGVTKYNDYMREGHCYRIAGGSIAAVNKRYTTIKCGVSIALTAKSSVIEILDDGSIPQNGFNFTPISSIPSLSVNSLVDVVGVVKKIYEKKLKISKLGEEVKKRKLKLYDEQGRSIEITLWKEVAHIKLKENEVVAFKVLRVTEYNNIKSLSSVGDTSIVHNIRGHKLDRLKKWACNNSSARSHPKSKWDLMVRVL